ncbi:MAG: hypothetical protein EOP56_14485 [Sphingobacteriales bacterium]|nr:MAG: hypothetical protein EOP56_14485 [Sphingobacteriales bacterium]
MKQLMRIYTLLFVACLCGSNSFAQTDVTIKGADSSGFTAAAQDTTAIVPDTTAVDSSKIIKARPKPPVRPKKPKPISKEFSGGFRLNSDGWSVFIDKGTVQSEEKFSDLFYDIKLMQLEFTEKKHPKELKRSNGTPGGPTFGGDKAKPFVYGKVNNFYGLKFGYGKRKMIAGKPDPGTISIHWVYLGGLVAGLEKPYYVKAYVVEKGAEVEKDIKYTDSTQGYFLNNFRVIGGSGFSQGLGEIKVVPGIHAKTGLHFDFASGRHTKMAIEMGVNAEFYMRSIAIMANQKARPIFMNVYASVQFGKRK